MVISPDSKGVWLFISIPKGWVDAFTLLACMSHISALTHIMRICCDFDVANLPRYRDNNTLPHIVRFHGKIQETLCKSREAVLQNQGGDCFFYSYATVVLILSNKRY